MRNGDGTADGGYRCATEFMRAPDPPTAIFCGNDPTAMGAYETLKERGLRIPEDVAVVGFDNQELIAAHLRPALSTVALPHHEMGRWAVEYLIGLIDRAARGETPPPRHAIGCPYVGRESVLARRPGNGRGEEDLRGKGRPRPEVRGAGIKVTAGRIQDRRRPASPR